MRGFGAVAGKQKKNRGKRICIYRYQHQFMYEKEKENVVTDPFSPFDFTPPPLFLIPLKKKGGAGS